MSIGRIGVLLLAACVAIGGGIWAFADTGRDPRIGAIDLDEGAVRREDAGDEIASVEDDGPEGDEEDDRTGRGDGGRTRGNDRTRGGVDTGDGDRTDGNDGTAGGDNTGDGDATDGNDGTGGGDNTEVTYDAPAGTTTGGGTT